LSFCRGYFLKMTTRHQAHEPVKKCNYWGCKRAKFRGDRSNRGRDMAIFSSFQNGGHRHLGFSNLKFLTVGRLKRAEVRRDANFGRNRSNRGKIWRFFDFFKMASVRHLGFVTCVRTTHERHLVFIAVQNLAGIDAVVFIICMSFDFMSLASEELSSS